MTTFTTEDRLQFQKPSEPTWEEKWGKVWVDSIKGDHDWYTQTKIEYFWPLTEQIGLELDYTGCSKESTLSYTIGSTVIGGQTWGTIGMSTIAPQLTITPNNPVGTLSIGGINIGLEKKPNIFQRVIHKLLGFGWKDQ